MQFENVVINNMPSSPGGAETITIFDSSVPLTFARPINQWGARALFNLTADEDSELNGVVIESSADGSEWDAVTGFPATYTAASGAARWEIPISDKYLRITYINGQVQPLTWLPRLEIRTERS